MKSLISDVLLSPPAASAFFGVATAAVACGEAFGGVAVFAGDGVFTGEAVTAGVAAVCTGVLTTALSGARTAVVCTGVRATILAVDAVFPGLTFGGGMITAGLTALTGSFEARVGPTLRRLLPTDCRGCDGDFVTLDGATDRPRDALADRRPADGDLAFSLSTTEAAPPTAL